MSGVEGGGFGSEWVKDGWGWLGRGDLAGSSRAAFTLSYCVSERQWQIITKIVS